MTCDASTYVKGYSIFSKGITLCGKPVIAIFDGVRIADGKTCRYVRCAEHADETDETDETLRRNLGGTWDWSRTTT